MKNFFRRLAGILLVISLSAFYALPVFATEQTGTDTVQLKAEIAQTAEYIKSTTKINLAKDFYNSTKTLILLLRSGTDCKQLTNEYFSQLDTVYYKDGNLIFNSPLTDYGLLSTLLALTGRSATDYKGVDVLHKFESAILDADQNELNNVNPYQLSVIYLTALSYSDKLTNSEQILSKIKDAILHYGNENGINYWGNSPDNNGFVLSGLTSIQNTDEQFKKLTEDALKFSQSLLNEDGTSKGYYEGPTEANADSTAASLSFFSTYGQKDLAQQSYRGLSAFRNSDGSYHYTLSDSGPNDFATADAFYALLAHYSTLANQVFPFYTKDVLAYGIPSETQPAPNVSEETTPVITENHEKTIIEASQTKPETDLTISEFQDEASPATFDHSQLVLAEVLFILSTFSLIAFVKKSKNNMQ